MTNVADDRAGRVRREQPAGVGRDLRRGSSASRLDEAGKLRPMTNVAGRTTRTTGRRIAQSVSSAFDGSRAPGGR